METSEEEIERRDLCEILNTFIDRPVLWAKQSVEAVLLKLKKLNFLKYQPIYLVCFARGYFDELILLLNMLLFFIELTDINS